MATRQHQRPPLASRCQQLPCSPPISSTRRRDGRPTPPQTLQLRRPTRCWRTSPCQHRGACAYPRLGATMGNPVALGPSAAEHLQCRWIPQDHAGSWPRRNEGKLSTPNTRPSSSAQNAHRRAQASVLAKPVARQASKVGQAWPHSLRARGKLGTCCSFKPNRDSARAHHNTYHTMCHNRPLMGV
ncbi:MAG: hypothetical protein ACI9MC_004100 [Kiritimatiellia bacterium]|jgi:hypothetical protein